MKNKLFLAVALLVAGVMQSWACTNLIVGRHASTDGSTIVSYSADSYGMYGYLCHYPAAVHAEGTWREILDWESGRYTGRIPEAAQTYNVIGNINEYQVTIAETTFGGREELVNPEGIIDYGSLIYLALQRSKTAREAIDVMTSLVEEYGYNSSGESFSIADPNEVWLMELIGRGKGQKGALWVAVRIPDNAICAHANQARITTIPQGKTKLSKEQKRLQKELNCVCNGDWMYSKDVIDFAREKGYFTGADKDFSYQAAYCPFDFSGLFVCEARVWSFFRHFSNQMDQYYDYAIGHTYKATEGKDEGEHMPLWIVPNHKVSVQEMKDCMRDEYKGTPIDITQGIDAGPWNSKLRYGGLGFQLDSIQHWYARPTATQQTAWSFVAQMRANKKHGIFWFGVDDAACTCYVPMYSGITKVPECFAEGNGDSYTYSPTSAWWTFNIVANWAYTKYSRMYPHIQELQQIWSRKACMQMMLQDYKKRLQSIWINPLAFMMPVLKDFIMG